MFCTAQSRAGHHCIVSFTIFPTCWTCNGLLHFWSKGRGLRLRYLNQPSGSARWLALVNHEHLSIHPTGTFAISSMNCTWSISISFLDLLSHQRNVHSSVDELGFVGFRVCLCIEAQDSVV